jgi:predicted metal-dependent hydrolase
MFISISLSKTKVYRELIMRMQKNYIIRRSQRAKRARIIVTAEAVELVAPIKMPMTLLQQFADSKSEWIVATQKKIQQKTKSIMRFSPLFYKESSLLMYSGELYPLLVQFSNCSQLSFNFDIALTVTIPNSLKLNNEQVHSDLIREAYIEWLWRQSLNKVKISAEKYGELYQLNPRSIRIREQKSRWGSCGIHDDIYMNWLLILAPIEVLEYVVIHEICHILYRNHSASFWQLVVVHCPNYKAHRLWLKQYGSALMQAFDV